MQWAAMIIEIKQFNVREKNETKIKNMNIHCERRHKDNNILADICNSF